MLCSTFVNIQSSLVISNIIVLNEFRIVLKLV